MSSDEARGLWLGLIGVLIFSLTLPMTRLAVGSPDAPQLSGWFVAFGRAAVAGILSLFFLAFTRAPRPAPGDWPLILAIAAGAVFGFPLFTSVAMRHVEAVHASVMLGVLPLATALVGAWANRQRPSAGFWACAALGSALVMAFAVLKSGAAAGSLSIHWADGLLLAAMAWGALAYVAGGKLAGRLRADHVICAMPLFAARRISPGLAERLPAHMIPAHFVALSALPLTASTRRPTARSFSAT